MVDVSYSNKYTSLTNCSKVEYATGDISLKLNNDIGINAMAAFVRGFKSNRHKLYGGIGINYSDYEVNRNIYIDQQGNQGHFPMTSSYTPNKLNYNLQSIRFQIHLNHYTFFKRIMIFQKLGLAYTSFISKTTNDSQYEEKYGNSVPYKDPVYITPSNPDGWAFTNNYTYTTKHDVDIYKNGFTAFYRFGFGIRIKNFTPFIGFETSNVSGKFWSLYLNGQVGINYSFIKR